MDHVPSKITKPSSVSRTAESNAIDVSTDSQLFVDLAKSLGQFNNPLRFEVGPFLLAGPREVS